MPCCQGCGLLLQAHWNPLCWLQETGFDLIYEARELDLPQSARDGMTQARGDLSATKERVALSEKRIDNELGPSIEKNYWQVDPDGGE